MSDDRWIDQWGARPWIDLIVGGVVAVGYAVWRAAGGGPLVVLDEGDRQQLYVVVAGAAGALLAFGITPIAIILALAPGPRLRALLARFSGEIRRTLMAALWLLLALLVASISAIAIDTGGSSEGWIRFIVLALAVAALLAIVRLVRMFGLLMRNIGLDNETQHRADVSELRRRAG